MAESGGPLIAAESPKAHPQDSTETAGTDEGNSASVSNGLSHAQQEVLERCLHALTHAKNDSHTLAALLLITRLCPAKQLDSGTLHRIFEAVGLNLPARLLVTAVRGSDGSGLPPEELLSLGTALLAALSTDPGMAAHPQFLSTIPLLLGLVADGPPQSSKNQSGDPGSPCPPTEEYVSSPKPKHADQACREGIATASDTQRASSGVKGPGQHQGDRDSSTPGKGAETADGREQNPSTSLDEALAADCYQVLNTICALPRGPEQLLNRGAVPALCRAVTGQQTLSREKGLPLLGHLLSSGVRERAWTRHQPELLSLLEFVCLNFCQISNQERLQMCSCLPQFLPPPGGAVECTELKRIVSNLWQAVRPMVQSKLTTAHLGPVLVLSACLLDLCRWDNVGPPKFCCLLVNRACVEIRMGLEEPPGTELSPQQQHTLTACYRITEAAMEQACSQGLGNTSTQSQSAVSGLSLQQSRQVLDALEEASSAMIYYLKQVGQSQYDDPFIYATFRALCAWLAEETSCLKDEVTDLLPFLIGYAESFLQGERKGKGLANWMSEMSVNDRSQEGTWTGEDPLRYLLPALCHLSAEEGPRRVLLTLDTPALLVGFLNRGWGVLRGQSGKTVTRDPSMETACSALLNFVVTEPERVRTDACFASLETLLSEALPVLLHKPRLLVLTANFCTLGLMTGRLKPPSTAEPAQRQFFSVTLRFLLSALEPGTLDGQVRISRLWEEWWEEAGELWRLSLQALGDCVRALPWITAVVREEGWLQNTLSILSSGSVLPDPQTGDALEEALSAMASHCQLCRQDIRAHMRKEAKSALYCMTRLKKSLSD
ncbi:neurochondrin isoform X2 [Chanos chanos]|uniref:Neurochondrin n=1 Tax=Chanos chanos TaxID=29144 RepID=A0A6J2WKK5_CHACN|nr:neurochondrin isoform X2 [Chanos chanos]